MSNSLQLALSVAYELNKGNRPERWENAPEAITSIPGVWGNMLSFLAGPRACIGYRFSLVESVIPFAPKQSLDIHVICRTKALLFSLVRAFEFELAVAPGKVTKRSTIVQRPVILGEDENSNQMPLIVRPYVQI